MRPALKRDPAPSLPNWRANLLLIVIGAWFIGLTGRALWLQALNNDFLQRKGESRYSRVIEIGASRGMIVDRNNEPLAISTPVESGGHRGRTRRPAPSIADARHQHGRSARQTR